MKVFSLKGDSAFARLRHGKRASSSFLGVRWRICSGHTPDTGATRVYVGIITNKKVSKKAVIRNRVRRRTREALRDLLHEPTAPHIKSLKNYELLIISYPSSAAADYWQLRAALKHALERSGFPIV